MTEFECGCRIVSEMINLNRADYRKPFWNHLLKTFVNVCGNCGKKQMKFQQTENKLMDMEKQRKEWFMNFEEEDEEEEYDEEYKEQFRNMTDEEVERHIGLERVRNVMEGYDKEHGIEKIRRIVKEVRDEEIEKNIENNTFDPYDLWSPRTREEHDKWNEEQYNKESLEEDNESDDSQTQRMKRLQWIKDNKKPKN